MIPLNTYTGLCICICIFVTHQLCIISEAVCKTKRFFFLYLFSKGIFCLLTEEESWFIARHIRSKLDGKPTTQLIKLELKDIAVTVYSHNTLRKWAGMP